MQNDDDDDINNNDKKWCLFEQCGCKKKIKTKMKKRTGRHTDVAYEKQTFLK